MGQRLSGARCKEAILQAASTQFTALLILNTENITITRTCKNAYLYKPVVTGNQLNSTTKCRLVMT